MKPLLLKNVRDKMLSTLMSDVLVRVHAGEVVGFWPCNEITTNILTSKSGFNSRQLRLFDIDSAKHGIDWCDIGCLVHAPETNKLSECSCIYLCSPSYNNIIEENLNEMKLSDLMVIKVQLPSFKERSSSFN